MKLIVFSVYDKAVGAFLPPFFLRSKGEAIRSFSSAVGDAKHQFATNRSDYALFELGSWDDGNGMLEPLATPMKVIEALEVVAGDA